MSKHKRAEELLRLSGQDLSSMWNWTQDVTGRSKSETSKTSAPASTSNRTSDPAKQAEELLRQHTANKPAAYQSRYQSNMDSIMSQLQNREPFRYDVNGDALYQQYKDRYIHNGQRAMQDTMGQAAALTGGYGSSYAQNVGQQAYNEYMTGLNDVIPELYQLALDKYDRETANLQNQYAMYADLDAQDYSRWLDSQNAYYSQLDRLTENARYEKEQRDVKYQQALAEAEKRAEQEAEDDEEAPLEKAIFSHVDEDGNYHYYRGGKEVVFASGVNPHHGSMNPDVKYGTFETDVTNYQPNNIGGVPLEAVGKGMINGHEQNVWKKADDGSLWMWDDTVNKYVEYDQYIEIDTNRTKTFKASVMTEQEFSRRNYSQGKTASYNDYLEKTIDKWLNEGRLDDSEAAALLVHYGLY